MEKLKYLDKIWDKIGICGSTLCIIHCLTTPVLLLLYPATNFSEMFGFDHAHEIFAIIVTASILVAVYPTCREHGHKDIIALAITGITFIFCSLFFENLYSLSVVHGLTITGSIFLIMAHIKNMHVRHGKCAPKTKCSH